ncbi:DUF1963 domain-containing protein [Chthoniobacter flavus]|uniref:DUF1963 domain-containing protein n=1 Tax=Chthoniobacter flavus TaxID=191863 RepID=UPI00138AFA47|nr:DUF1963 domain-containing protein [Chthoniobacter flavus]
MEEALRTPEMVVRLRIYRHTDPAALARVAELKNLQSLSISLADVSQLLPRLDKMKNLQILHLQACNIPTFPESILSLSNLRSLSIGNSSLGALPEKISGLDKLEELSLSQNSLERIPQSIGRLTQLQRLGLSYNKLEELPESLGNLGALVWLFLDVNRLRQVPESIGELARLKSLSLNCNDLRTIPESICRLTSLERLSIERNPLESLPGCLSTMGIETISIEAEKRPLFMDWTYQPSDQPPRIALTDMKLFVEPASPFHAPLLAATESYGAGEFAPLILGLAREAVRIDSTVPDDYSRPGNSRLGGFPDLSDSELFPRDEEGRYWIFLAQLNLEDLASLNTYLPRAGLLSFFIESTESLKARVLFFEGDVRELKTIRHAGGEAMTDDTDDYTQSPYGVKFQRFVSLPHCPPEEMESGEAPDTYEKIRELSKGGDHYINGYTFTQHESPQEQAANELRGKPEEWVPLLQLGWDDKVGFCFWDAGTVTFTIHREDLRRGDFSRVHASLETS